MGAALVEIRNVSKSFTLSRSIINRKPSVLQAVSDVSLDIMKGESLGLVGESGSGKSTLGHVVLNLLKPTAGEVYFDGQNITALRGRDLLPYRRRMQLIFQDPFSSLNPTQSVGAMLSEILFVHRICRTAAERKDKVRDILRQVGLSEAAARRYPHEFSGGQRQRLVIARALACDPEFIVADEPVSALDVSIQAQIVKLLEKLRQELGLTLLLVAHDLGLIQYMSDRVGVLYLGKLVELAPTRRLFAAPRHPYTEMLLSAAPSIEVDAQKKRIVPTGEIPSPLSPPSGCVFRTRCRYALPACATSKLTLTKVGDGHFKACIRNDILGGPNA